MADGHELWQQQQTVPKLSLRGTASPAIAGDVAVTGFDNGRVVATSLTDGASVWETQLQIPAGKTDIDRLADVDTRAQIIGNDVYVVGFQGKVAMMALDSGQIWWSHDTSSYRGVALDDDNVYVSTAGRRGRGAEAAHRYRGVAAEGAWRTGACQVRPWPAMRSWSRTTRATCTGWTAAPVPSSAASARARCATPTRRCMPMACCCC